MQSRDKQAGHAVGPNWWGNLSYDCPDISLWYAHINNKNYMLHVFMKRGLEKH
jgi:hypothetical protein